MSKDMMQDFVVIKCTITDDCKWRLNDNYMGVLGRRSNEPQLELQVNDTCNMLAPVSLHKRLCEIGARWLLNAISWNFRCNYVITEFVSMCAEQPDVLGYKGGSRTILIEVKTSRSDFMADFKKPHRASGGIGLFRYYLCPNGMIKPEELPECWGLLYADDTMKIEVVKESEVFNNRDFDSEMEIMYSIVRRLAGKRQVFNFRNGC